MRRPRATQCFGQHGSVPDDLLLVNRKLGSQRFLEGHSLTGDYVHQRTALNAGEDCRIDRLLVFNLH